MPPMQLQNSKLRPENSLQQPCGSLNPSRPGASPTRYACTPQRAVGQRAEAYPLACGTRLSENHVELQQPQRLPTPLNISMLPRSQQIREQLDRQRTHRQQLLQRSAYPPQHILMQLGSHLQTFTSWTACKAVGVNPYDTRRDFKSRSGHKAHSGAVGRRIAQIPLVHQRQPTQSSWAMPVQKLLPALSKSPYV